MTIYLLSFTAKGSLIEEKILNALKEQGNICLAYAKYPINELSTFDTSLKEFASEAFEKGECIVFIGSIGIAVRGIAPLVKSKDVDPAVIVADDTGKYVIPILSGHLGGANWLASVISHAIGAECVLTTSTDRNGVFAVDSWSRVKGLFLLDVPMIKKVSGAILNGEEVGFISDFPIAGHIAKGLKENSACKTGISVSFNKEKRPFENTLRLIPKDCFLGVGCRKNTSTDVFENCVKEFLEKHHIAIERVASVASIDLKSEEKAILDFAKKYRIPFMTFSSSELEKAKGTFLASSFVKSITGVDNVCERAAVISSKSSLAFKKEVSGGVTVAASLKDFICEF